MRFIDGSGTHTFNVEQVSDIGNSSKDKRVYRYKSVDLLDSESLISSDRFITFNVYQLTEAQLETLSDIVIDNNLTSIDNSDEVLVGESFRTLLGATHGIYIKTPELKPKPSIDTKGVRLYNTRLKIRFDTKTDAIKV